MMQMRQTIPGADTAAQVSRPMTIGGSRLSLLARQLTASPQGPGGLPEAPDPLANDDLPGADAPRAVPMPDALRHQAAAQKMLHSQINRGRGVNMGGRSSGRFLRFAMSALFLLTAAGIAVYVMRDSLGLTKHFVEVEPVEPRTSEPSSGRAPEPGIDPVTDDAPAPVEEKPQPPKPRVVYAPPQAPVVKPAPAAPTVVVPRAVVSPEPEESPAAKIAGQKPATRAMPVDDEPPAPKAIPVENEPSERTAVVTQKPEAPKSDDRALVEVGRTKDEPKILAGNNASMKVVNSDNLDKPLVKNVPPKCQAALQGLKSFLAARSLKERLPYMQLASQIERKAAIYYTSNPDGPVEVDEIHYLRHDESPQVGRGMHAVFVLFNRSWDYGIPVMVEQTGDGVRVDWLSFIEFKDDLLHKFLTNYMDGPVRFHVGIRRTHYFEDDIPGIENKDTFEVTPPMENVHGFVFVPRGSALQRSLAGTISWDKEMSWVIVELQWRREGTAKWIEMTALPQLNWYSAGDEEATDAASASSPPVRK